MLTNAIILGGLNLFWVIYLTWEMKHYKRPNDDNLRWWERDLDQG